MQIEALVFLAIIILAFGGAMIWLWRQNRKDVAGLEALAARRGWTAAHTLPSGGKGRQWSITPPDDSWRLIVTRFQGENGASVVRTTEWRDATAMNPAGVVAIGPGLGGAAGSMAGSLLGSLDNPMGAMLLRTVFGAGADEIAGLRPLPDPASGFSAFASAGAADGIDLAAIVGAIRQWADGRSGATAEPIVIFGAEGLRVRLRNDVTDANTLSDFIDLALGVRGALPRQAVGTLRP